MEISLTKSCLLKICAAKNIENLDLIEPNRKRIIITSDNYNDIFNIPISDLTEKNIVIDLNTRGNLTDFKIYQNDYKEQNIKNDNTTTHTQQSNDTILSIAQSKLTNNYDGIYNISPKIFFNIDTGTDMIDTNYITMLVKNGINCSASQIRDIDNVCIAKKIIEYLSKCNNIVLTFLDKNLEQDYFSAKNITPMNFIKVTEEPYINVYLYYVYKYMYPYLTETTKIIEDKVSIF